MTKDELKLAFQKAFQMGQDYWYHANHEFESYNKKSDAIKEKFNEMVKETIEEALAQPELRPDEISTDELIYMNGLHDGMKQERALWELSKLGQEIEADTPKIGCVQHDCDECKARLAQPEERNFCPRCGKRTPDLTTVHTCTPPGGIKENT